MRLGSLLVAALVVGNFTPLIAQNLGEIVGVIRDQSYAGSDPALIKIRQWLATENFARMDPEAASRRGGKGAGVKTNEVLSKAAARDTSVARVEMKLEAVVIPVKDVNCAKEFYGRLGWRLDADSPFDDGFRVVQFTPPGSGCSIQFVTNITSAAPGSAQGLYLIVSGIEAAREQLVARGVKVSEVFHAATPGAQFDSDGSSGRAGGPAPDHASYLSYATFRDPDGNGWLLQEITTSVRVRSRTSRQVVSPLAASSSRNSA